LRKLQYKKKSMNNIRYKNNFCLNTSLLFINKNTAHSYFHLAGEKERENKPFILYVNSLLNKPNILNENKGKSGVYK